MLKTGIFGISLLFIFIFFISANFLCCQEPVSSKDNLEIETVVREIPSSTNEVIELEQEESTLERRENLQWVWGEVVEVNAPEKKLAVRYLDYDTDGEKDSVFIFEENSEFENITSIENIRVGDSAGIDYYINEDGAYLIKSISIEKLNIPKE